MILRIEVSIDIENIDPDVVIKSLGPDNIDIPAGMNLHVSKNGNRVVVAVECVEDKILTCRSTADEILMLIDSIIKSLRIGG